jgi:ribosome maturation factor RimP
MDTCEARGEEMAVTDQVEQLIAPAVESLGYELVGVEYIQGGSDPILRIYIDAEQGIMIEDCERVSHQVSGVLDVEDPIRSAYLLEVSSPGFDRPLFKARDFERFSGSQAKIVMKLPVDGRRNFTGTLAGMDADEILIEVDGETYALPLIKLAKARLIA